MWCKSSGIQKEGRAWWWPQASKLEGGIKEKNSIERQLWKGGASKSKIWHPQTSKASAGYCSNSKSTSGIKWLILLQMSLLPRTLSGTHVWLTQQPRSVKHKSNHEGVSPINAPQAGKPRLPSVVWGLLFGCGLIHDCRLQKLCDTSINMR